MLIQAHKRKTFRDTLLGGKTVRQSHVVELGDEVYRFIANDAGHSVCEVTDEAHIKRLLSIQEAYKEYGTKTEAPVASTAFVVEGPNGERKDLAELDDEQLKEFAAVAEVTVGDRLKGDKLRTAIVKALKD
jgi:hypothetical protein